MSWPAAHRGTRRRRAGRGRHRIAATSAAAIVAAAVLAGCVTDRTDEVPAPPATGPDGPACLAGKALTEELAGGIGSDPTAAHDSLERLERELPLELRGFVDILLSPEDVSAPDGSSGYATAWKVLDGWSATVCERPLLPAAFEQPDLSWIPDDEWEAAGSAPTATPTDEPATGDDGPPPALEGLVASIVRDGGEAAWFTDEVTGMVGWSELGTTITVDGVDTAALAHAACEDLMTVLGARAQPVVVVRGLGGEALAVTDGAGCRTARGA